MPTVIRSYLCIFTVLVLNALLVSCYQRCSNPGYPDVFTNVGGNGGTLCELPGQGYDPVTERCPHAAPLVEYSFDKDCTFVVPQSDQTLANPDQTYPTGLTGLIATSEISIYDSEYAYEKNYISKTDLSLSIGSSNLKMSLAFNSSLTRVKKIVNNGEHNFSQSILVYPGFTLELSAPTLLQLSPEFSSAIESLDKQYNQQQYCSFVRYFGCFFLRRAYYGGQFNQTVVLDSSLFKSESYESVEKSISATFQATAGNYSIPLNYNSVKGWNETEQYRVFSNHSVSPWDIQGGSAEAFTNGGYPAWIPTLYKRWTVLIYQSFVSPIYTLIKDPVRAENLKQAILDYGNGRC